MTLLIALALSIDGRHFDIATFHWYGLCVNLWRVIDPFLLFYVAIILIASRLWEDTQVHIRQETMIFYIS